MPIRRMPSLSALRAFEAAARRMSFKEAASELGVTPGAISQQIRGLEEELGTSLFDRGTRSVALTQAGRRLSPEVTESFMRIRDAVDDIRQSGAASLSICAAGMVIRNWLLPKLHSFTERYPDLETHVRALHSWEGFEYGPDEVGIRLLQEPPTGVYSRRIHQVLLLPLASPDFIERHKITGPEDALRLPLLQDAVVQLFEKSTGWEMWFEKAGLTEPVPQYALNFDPYSADYALDMALSGNGLLLGWSIQCFQAMSQGRLCCPFGPVVELDFDYYLVCRKPSAKRPHIRAFMDWAEQEAALLSTLRSLQLGAA